MGYVYLICDSTNDVYKVGMTTKSPEKRLNELKTGNSSELFIITSYETKYYKLVEKNFHNRYKHFCENREWFNLPDAIVLDFTKICQEIEDTHIFLLENNDIYRKKNN